MSGYAVGLLPDGFWNRSDVVAALSVCDIPAIIDTVRRELGWSQDQVGQAIGYSQGWVSKVINGHQPVTTDQARIILTRLCVPLHMVRMGPLTWGGDDPTKRRKLIKTAMVAGLSAPNAHVALSDSLDIDDVTPTALRTVTSNQRRLDATTPSRDLAEAVTAHYDLARRLLTRAHGGAHHPMLAAATSEIAGFAAWLHFDMQDLGSARLYYQRAIHAAIRADDPLLTDYMLGSLASFEVDADDPLTALTLIGEAQRLITDAAPATARAWLASIEAVAHAARRDAASAGGCLTSATQYAAAAERAGAPPWPWVFPFDQTKVDSYRALCAVRLEHPREALAIFKDTPVPATSPKQIALGQLAQATAHAQLNHVEDAFALASQALATGQRSGSERVLRHARTFRRGYTGSTTDHVKAFDAQLRATLP